MLIEDDSELLIIFACGLPCAHLSCLTHFLVLSRPCAFTVPAVTQRQHLISLCHDVYPVIPTQHLIHSHISRLNSALSSKSALPSLILMPSLRESPMNSLRPSASQQSSFFHILFPSFLLLPSLPPQQWWTLADLRPWHRPLLFPAHLTAGFCVHVGGHFRLIHFY